MYCHRFSSLFGKVINKPLVFTCKCNILLITNFAHVRFLNCIQFGEEHILTYRRVWDMGHICLYLGLVNLIVYLWDYNKTLRNQDCQVRFIMGMNLQRCDTMFHFILCLFTGWSWHWRSYWLPWIKSKCFIICIHRFSVTIPDIICVWPFFSVFTFSCFRETVVPKVKR